MLENLWEIKYLEISSWPFAIVYLNSIARHPVLYELKPGITKSEPFDPE